MGKMRQFKRAIRGCIGKPLLFDMRAGYGAAVGAVLERVARGERVRDAEIHEIMGDSRAADIDDADEPRRTHVSSDFTVPGGPDGKDIAFISMRGIALYGEEYEYQPICFSTAILAQTVTRYANDPKVGMIILDVDSPGGMVTGTAEAADAIYAAAKRKKVMAFVRPLAASAGYWLVSQATEIIAIKSGDVGSIGCFMAHTDCSKFNEMQGMAVTYIYAGEYKIEGNPDQPLSNEARAYYQSEVDVIYKDFLKAVARGRGKSVDDVFENFGKGRCMMAPMAKKVGMIDDFMTIDAALSRWGVSTMPAHRGRRGEADAEAGADDPVAGVVGEGGGGGMAPADIDPGEISAKMAALLEGSESITVSIVADGDKRTVYAADKWPGKTVIARSFLDDASGFVQRVDAAGDLDVTVANGTALYRKIGEGYDGAWICELVECTYEPMPVQPAAEAEAEAEEGLERLAAIAADIAKQDEAAARARRLSLLRA